MEMDEEGCGGEEEKRRAESGGEGVAVQAARAFVMEIWPHTSRAIPLSEAAS
jgi:hypothetical protein